MLMKVPGSPTGSSASKYRHSRGRAIIHHEFMLFTSAHRTVRSLTRDQLLKVTKRNGMSNPNWLQGRRRERLTSSPRKVKRANRDAHRSLLHIRGRLLVHSPFSISHSVSEWTRIISVTVLSVSQADGEIQVWDYLWPLADSVLSLSKSVTDNQRQVENLSVVYMREELISFSLEQRRLLPVLDRGPIHMQMANL